MKKEIIILFIFILSIAEGIACSCIGSETLKEAIKSSDIVFNGTVLDIKIHEKFDTTGYEMYRKYVFNQDSTRQADSTLYLTKELHYVIKITKKYKGEYRDSIIIIHSGAIGHDDCKYKFEKGKSYLIFANNKLIWTRDIKLRKDGSVRRKGKYHKDKTKFETDACHKNQIYSTKYENEILENLK